MSPAEASAAQVRRLLAEVRADHRAINDRTSEIQRFADLTSAPPERPGALALSLDRAYTALESLLDRVARALEGGASTGADWHQALLSGAGLAIEEVRPPILTSTSLAAADEVRRFRHFLRHAYGAALEPVRLTTLAKTWLAAQASLAGDLDSFEAFLLALAKKLERAR